jgi:hypothetical protein
METPVHAYIYDRPVSDATVGSFRSFAERRPTRLPPCLA